MAAIFPASTDGDGECFAFPDVCKTPMPSGPPIPLPYPNVARLTSARETSTKVRFAGRRAVHTGSEISRSSGDEAGSAGGVLSGKHMGPATFRRGSSKVRIEGRPAVHLCSPTGQNGTSANIQGMQVSPSQTKVLVAP